MAARKKKTLPPLTTERRNGTSSPAPRGTLRRWNQLTEFIRLICWTGFVANGRPQSLFLCSEPGEGKTELLDRFRVNQFLAYYSDATYRTVLTVLGDAMMRKRTHMVLTEFQKIIARKKQVADNTLSIILQAMEEGIWKIGYGPTERDFRGTRVGVLAATTVTSLIKNPYMVKELAIHSRAYFVDARGTIAELREIERRIVAGDQSALKPVLLRSIPAKPVTVVIPERIGQVCRVWVREMEDTHVPVFGVRTLNRFLHTLRGVTLMNGRDVATRADTDELYTFRNLWLQPPPMPVEDDSTVSHFQNGGGDR